MKINQYFLIFLTLLLISCNKKSVHTRYHQNGNIKSKGSLVNDLEHGEWIAYYKSGELFKIVNYKNGVLDGKFEEFHKSGKLLKTGQLKNGVNVGEWEIFNDKGELESWTDFGEGDGNSIHKKFYTSGNVEMIFQNFESDNPLVISYHENGNLESQGLFNSSGEKVGDWKHYNEEGKLKYSGNYINDKPDGEWKEFNKDGSVYKIKFWEKGNLISESK